MNRAELKQRLAQIRGRIATSHILPVRTREERPLRVSAVTQGIAAAALSSASHTHPLQFLNMELDEDSSGNLILGGDVKPMRATLSRSGYPFYAGVPRHGDNDEADVPWVARGVGSDLGVWHDATNIPAVEDGLSGPVEQLTGHTWQLEPYPLDDSAHPDDKALAEKHYQICRAIIDHLGAEATTTLVEQSLRQVRAYGFGTWEITTTPITARIGGHMETIEGLRSVDYIYPNAIRHWLTGARGELLGVAFDFSQTSSYAGLSTHSLRTIPIHKLIHTRRYGYGANYEGRSDLRSCYQPIQMWKIIYQLQALSAEASALGWFHVQQMAGAPAWDVDAMTEVMDAFIAREVPYAQTPEGWVLNHFKPEDMGKDFTSLIQLYDAHISMSLRSTSTMTGMLDASGSYAMQEAKNTKDRGGLAHLAQRLVTQPLSGQLFARLLALNCPDDARLFPPLLTPRDTTSRDVPTWIDALSKASALSDADGNPLLFSKSRIGQQVRTELGLPADLEPIDDDGDDATDGDEVDAPTPQPEIPGDAT